MANVFFKRGSQATLDAYNGSGYTEGAFYLTNDTNRLYFAQASDKLVDLNQYIHIHTGETLPVSTSTSPLKDGDFYYWTNNNILCIYRNGGWTQINPDTTLSPNQNAIIGVDTLTNGAGIGITVTDTKNVSATGDFSIVGGANVHVAVDGNVLTISADNDTTNTTYEVQTVYSTTDGKIKLHNTSSTSDADSTITIVGDGDNVTVDSTADGTIHIRGNAGVTGIADGFDENGVYGISINRTSGGDLETSGVTPTITYGVDTGKKESKVFANGTATLDVYSRTEIDALLDAQEAQLDAMHYAGAIDQATAAAKLVAAPAYGVGTTYKASEAISLASPSIEAKTGDLIVAGGSNDTAVVWEVIPSGDDQNLSITGSAAENVALFNDGVSGNQIGIIGIVGGRKDNAAANANIEVSTTVTGDNNEEVNFTVVHGAPGTGTPVEMPAASGAAIQTTDVVLNIPVITGISKDAQGHITNISAQTYQLKDTHAVLQEIQTSVEAVNNAASVAAIFQLDGGTQRDTGFTITSDNLKISANESDEIVVNLEWENF